MTQLTACNRCLARAWLLERLGGHIERVRSRIEITLALGDQQLIDAVGGTRAEQLRGELARVDPNRLRTRAAGAELELICRCDPRYPPRLTALESPPSVLHIAGGAARFLELVAEEPVALVGARRASSYGIEMARTLGHGLGAAGVTVLSGMALGIDSAAHAGALDARGPTIAVLPGGADRPYPASKRALHRQIQTRGAAVSELPPGSAAWRWSFPARNRIIAGLAAMTVVVEAGERSGALLTAAIALDLERPVGAVPGRVTSPLAAGPNRLLGSGAQIVRGPQDVLDGLYGAGARAARFDARPPLEPELARLLAAIGDGHDTSAALERAGFPAAKALAALASLELAGYVRREVGGRFAPVL
jgi:DNA processing protein